MTSLPEILDSDKSRSLGSRIAALPVRYWIAALIVLSVGYASVRFLPMIRRDLNTLAMIYEQDEEGIRLESELQNQIQESRRRFLGILLAGGNAPAVDRETRAMQAADLTVARIETQIDRLTDVPAQSQQQFYQNWQQYRASRDALLRTLPGAQSSQPDAARAEVGSDKFLLAEQAIQTGQQGFQAQSVRHLNAVAATLHNANWELAAWMLVKAVVLLAVIWLDARRRRAEQRLQQTRHELKVSEDRFRQAYESATVGMGIFKLDGSFISANPKTMEIFGYTEQELIGRKVGDFMTAESRADHQRRLRRMHKMHERQYQAERQLIRKDGEMVWVRNSVALLQPGEEAGHYFVITEEITHQKEAYDRLAFLANYDPITNLPSRRHFEELLVAALQSASAESRCIALIYLEIDSFDFLKGTFGRTVADEVLSDLGAMLEAFRQESETIGRLDDHVFALLLPAAPYDEATVKRGNELQEVFRHSSESGKHRIPLSVSIGIAYSSEGTASRQNGVPGVPGTSAEPAAGAETLLKFGRAAMLEARSRGGDCLYVADPALEERAAQRHRIESALLRGLREDEFRVVFQPQFEVATGRLVRFEALCRWTSRELGPIPPDRFIPIAEQTGLISEIGKRILHDSLQQARRWTDSGRRIGVAVNISPMQFMRPDFTNSITEVLALTQFPPELLELEITEGIFIRDLNLAVARIRELQRLGLSIALDDFGTGYSSLSYLQRMPIDAVKLDRSFVSDLTTEAATVSMVRSVLAMASALNLRVVTEGVETEEQFEILRSLGCDEAQGYLLGRPESSEAALQRVLLSPMVHVGSVA